VDRAFAKDAARNLTQAYQTRVDANVRFYRKGRFPVEGAKALAAALDLDAVAWEPQEAWVASSNDLACTRGTLTHTGQDGKVECQYVRMWKKQGSAWKLALDLELAQPAAK
jgi:hypothetical protein